MERQTVQELISVPTGHGHHTCAFDGMVDVIYREDNSTLCFLHVHRKEFTAWDSRRRLAAERPRSRTPCRKRSGVVSSQAKTIHPKKLEAMMLERTKCHACGRESNASLLRRWSSQSMMNSRLSTPDVNRQQCLTKKLHSAPFSLQRTNKTPKKN